MEERGRCARGRCVVCLGACAMDLIIRVPRLPEADEMVFADGEPGMFPGGSTANIAAGIARIGVASRFVGKVGDDGNGRALREAFVKDGVDVRWLVADPAGRTAQTVIAVDPSGSRVIYSLGGTALLESADEFAADILDGAAALYVGEAFFDVARRAMQEARNLGAQVVYGPGGMASWIGMENLAELMRLADFVLASRAELRAMTGRDEPDAGAQLLLEWGVPGVVATLGEQGAACYSRRPEQNAGPAWAPSFSVDVVDTTGAGDAFASGFISSLVEGRPTAECLSRGNACAAMAIGRVGAREAVPTREELEMFLAARGGVELRGRDGAES
ncbi:MAG: 5-dehydro-2-deoxygluconokinase [Firmicutes bacterium ADurb.BinA052]|nr:MAG: 5-dehydro-2-deoxygluconokinase [Firmicutes bacterium ADurb.BinA052]